MYELGQRATGIEWIRRNGQGNSAFHSRLSHPVLESYRRPIVLGDKSKNSA